MYALCAHICAHLGRSRGLCTHSRMPEKEIGCGGLHLSPLVLWDSSISRWTSVSLIADSCRHPFIHLSLELTNALALICFFKSVFFLTYNRNWGPYPLQWATILFSTEISYVRFPLPNIRVFFIQLRRIQYLSSEFLIVSPRYHSHCCPLFEMW